MKKKIIKIFSCVFLISTFAIVLSVSSVNKVDPIEQEVRTIGYENRDFSDESIFDEFDSYEIVETDDGLNVQADKNFSADIFKELDLVGLDDNIDDFCVTYELDYKESEDTVFLSVMILGEDDIELIDTVPGLLSINSSGESDILFSVDDELIWLSDLNESSVIVNTGWFKNLIKKITNILVKADSEVVKILEPIIRPAVNIATYFAVKLLGTNTAAYLGATILNMKADTEGIYHADFNCWQQYFGYTDLYDVVFDSATSMRFGKFEFDINDDGYFDYVLWAWKGNYLNLGAGAELGIYERWEYSDEIWKVDKDNAMTMTLKLEHKTKGTLFDWQPKDKQWWITGFDPKTQNVNRDNLKATYSVEFSNIDMYENFKNEWKYDSRWNFGTYKKPVLTLDWI